MKLGEFWEQERRKESAIPYKLTGKAKNPTFSITEEGRSALGLNKGINEAKPKG